MASAPTPTCDDLFDSIVQSIFGIGLRLEHLLESSESAAVRAQIDDSIGGLHDLIGLIRERGDLRCEASCSCSRQKV